MVSNISIERLYWSSSLNPLQINHLHFYVKVCGTNKKEFFCLQTWSHCFLCIIRTDIQNKRIDRQAEPIT